MNAMAYSKTPIRLGAVAMAVVLPMVLFSVIALLNEREFSREKLQGSVVNFDVEKRNLINKPKPKPKPKEITKRLPTDTPSLKPSINNDALALSGLSFGIPQFDESDFSGLTDQSLLDIESQADGKKRLDTRPKIVKRSPIVYPELARKQGISGYVVMNVLINEYGDVEDVVVLDSEPKDVFELKADSTIRSWKFEPATFNGRKVKTWATQKIAFKLQ